MTMSDHPAANNMVKHHPVEWVKGLSFLYCVELLIAILASFANHVDERPWESSSMRHALYYRIYNTCRTASLMVPIEGQKAKQEFFSDLYHQNICIVYCSHKCDRDTQVYCLLFIDDLIIILLLFVYSK